MINYRVVLIIFLALMFAIFISGLPGTFIPYSYLILTTFFGKDNAAPGYNASHLNYLLFTKENYKLIKMVEPHIYLDNIVMSEYSFAKIILNPVKTPADGISINMQSQDTLIKYTANPYGQNKEWSYCKVENRRDTTIIVRAAGDYKIYIYGEIYPGGYCSTYSFRDTIRTLYTHKDTIVYKIDY